MAVTIIRYTTVVGSPTVYGKTAAEDKALMGLLGEFLDSPKLRMPVTCDAEWIPLALLLFWGRGGTGRSILKELLLPP